MAVHHEFFERLFPVKKIVTYPEQIVFGLLVDRNAGANAGMDKEIITTTKRQFERLQKIEMLRREHVRELGRQSGLLVSIGIDARFKTIRQQGFETAVPAPFVEAAWIGEEARQECFMVSAKEDRFVSLPPLQQQIEHISQSGPLSI